MSAAAIIGFVLIALAGVWAVLDLTGSAIDRGLLEAEGWARHDVKRPQGPDHDGDGTPNDIHWPHGELPLRIEVSPSLDQKYVKALELAVAEVEEIAPGLFGDIETADSKTANYIEIGGSAPRRGAIYVHDDAGTEPYHGRTTIYRLPDGRITSTVIQLPVAALKTFMVCGIVLHEVLHSLGLDHDDDPESVMYPVAQKRPQRITEKDRALLTRLYSR